MCTAAKSSALDVKIAPAELVQNQRSASLAGVDRRVRRVVGAEQIGRETGWIAAVFERAVRLAALAPSSAIAALVDDRGGAQIGADESACRPARDRARIVSDDA